MTSIDIRTNTDAVPIIETSLFSPNDEKDFVTIDLGYGVGSDERVDQNIFDGYLQLRKNVYADQKGFIDPLELENGKEIDENDERSRHMVVLHRREMGTAAVVACLRLIDKRAGEPLPIEQFFPEFSEHPASNNAIEVSRFISRSANGDGEQRQIVGNLFGTGLSYVINEGFDEVYGVIESPLQNVLQNKFAAPNKTITKPRWIESYNTENIGIKIDAEAMKHSMGRSMLRALSLQPGDVRFWSATK